MINDRRDSVKLVGDFFIEILKTPDHLCALAKKDDPKTVVSFQKLAEVYDEIKYKISYVPRSCFDPAVATYISSLDLNGDNNADDLKVVGENGKFLNGFKDNNPHYVYTSDRAVRGVYIDKICNFQCQTIIYVTFREF